MFLHLWISVAICSKKKNYTIFYSVTLSGHLLSNIKSVSSCISFEDKNKLKKISVKPNEYIAFNKIRAENCKLKLNAIEEENVWKWMTKGTQGLSIKFCDLE